MVHSGIRNYDGIKVLLMEALTATRAGIRSSIGVSIGTAIKFVLFIIFKSCQLSG